MKAWRLFLLILLIYMLLLGAVLSWHLLLEGHSLLHDEGYRLFVLAISMALVGLYSLGGVVGVIRYSTGIAVFILTCAAVSKLWMMFESRYLAWQMIVILGVQEIILVLGLGVIRGRGGMILHSHSTSEPRLMGARFAIRDVLILTASFAVLFAVLGSTEPGFSTVELTFVSVLAGAAAALVAATAIWLCLGTKTLWLRLATCSLVAPVGALLYTLAPSGTVRSSWQWFAGVTVTQMILMIIPLAVMRIQGFRFVRCK